MSELETEDVLITVLLANQPPYSWLRYNGIVFLTHRTRVWRRGSTPPGHSGIWGRGVFNTWPLRLPWPSLQLVEKGKSMRDGALPDLRVACITFTPIPLPRI